MPVREPKKLDPKKDQHTFDCIDAYFKWKEYDAAIRKISTRGVNLPSVVSEGAACHCLNITLNWETGGDAMRGDDVIEIKGTSNPSKELTSFSPSLQFDDLVFCALDREKDCLNIYDLKMSIKDIEKIMVNKTETFKDQTDDKRRPRFSVIKKIINDKGLKPDKVFDFNKAKELMKKAKTK